MVSARRYALGRRTIRFSARRAASIWAQYNYPCSRNRKLAGYAGETGRSAAVGGVALVIAQRSPLHWPSEKL
jgi:hypothetical protein